MYIFHYITIGFRSPIEKDPNHYALETDGKRFYRAILLNFILMGIHMFLHLLSVLTIIAHTYE